MPKKPKRPCSHAGCANLTDGRYCPEHTKMETKRYDKYKRDPEHNKRYGRSWKKIRAAFLIANPLCGICEQEGKLVPATTVHHKQKLTEGGTHDHKNLQSICASCHSRLHAKENGGWN